MSVNQRKAVDIISRMNTQVEQLYNSRYISVEEKIACAILINAISMAFDTLDKKLGGDILASNLAISLKEFPISQEMAVEFEGSFNHITLTKQMLSDLIAAVTTRTVLDEAIHLVDNGGDGSLTVLAERADKEQYEILRIPSFSNHKK
ncbi:MAG TPA: hypothetical protein VEB40_16805 [Flavipsychrobacter sp.]|nr:hypothetical protein [Flavipsychrobacter sp.]